MSNIRQNIIAVAFDKRGRILATGYNSYSKTHPLQKMYAARSSDPNRPFIHAELSALIKGSKRGKVHSLHVIRIRANGKHGLAKPCDICEKVIKAYNVKKVTWSRDVN